MATLAQLQMRRLSSHNATSSTNTCIQANFKRGSATSVQLGRGRQLERRQTVRILAEKKEYYDYKDMPPLPMTVQRIHVPKLDYTVVSKENESMRMASLAIFYDIYKDEQYKKRLTRKSAMTALCMYDRDDVQEAQNTPGEYPNIDLLYRVYNQGMDLEFVVEEFSLK